jgi:peptidoglycan/LPS O-acetylase OafA/YrhL
MEISVTSSKILGVLFLNHDYTKIAVDNPIILLLCLFAGFGLLILTSLKKTSGDQPLSVLQTTQMKGIAIIIINHLVLFTIDSSKYFKIFADAGAIGVSIFLMFSGYGLCISLNKKGIQNFFSAKIVRIYFPVFLAMCLEIFLGYFFYKKNNGLFEISQIFFNIYSIDRNMWFIVFLIFWYYLTYLVFRLNLENQKKVLFLFFTSILVLSIPNVSFLWNPDISFVWKFNAFSFPLGCLLGLNSQVINKKIGILLEQSLAKFFGIIISCIVISKICFPIANRPHVGVPLLISLIIIIGSIYFIKTKKKLESPVEFICLILTIFILYSNFTDGLIKAEIFTISRSFFYNLYSIFAAVSLVLLISLLVKFNFYSYFLYFVGNISFELYLLHGMFMYSFDFILFRGNISLTFFVYFLAICMASVAFKQLNSIVYTSALRKLHG